jgi:hypothetical protein
VIGPSRLIVELWSLSSTLIRECSIWSFVRHYSCNKYCIFVTMVILYLFSGHTYYEHSV